MGESAVVSLTVRLRYIVQNLSTRVSTPPFTESNMKDNRVNLYKWMWWTKGECVVEVLKTGHFPNTAMVRLPNDNETEIEIHELEMANDI